MCRNLPIFNSVILFQLKLYHCFTNSVLAVVLIKELWKAICQRTWLFWSLRVTWQKCQNRGGEGMGALFAKIDIIILSDLVNHLIFFLNTCTTKCVYFINRTWSVLFQNLLKTLKYTAVNHPPPPKKKATICRTKIAISLIMPHGFPTK